MTRPGQGNRLASGQASPPFCEDEQRDTVRDLQNDFELLFSMFLTKLSESDTMRMAT